MSNEFGGTTPPPAPPTSGGFSNDDPFAGRDPYLTDNGSPGSTSTESTGTKDVARDQAGQVGQTAKEAGGQVAGTAKEQAGHVAGEAKTQARNLLNETQGQVREQAGTQKDRASSGLRSLADELRSMADTSTQSGQSGMAGDLARQGSEKAQELARWLDAREPGALLDEVRDLARRKPGTFLIGAAVAGVVAGRLTRGAVDANRSGGTGTTDDADTTGPVTTDAWTGATDASTQQPLATPAGTPAGYAEPDPVFAETQVIETERAVSSGSRPGSYGSGEAR